MSLTSDASILPLLIGVLLGWPLVILLADLLSLGKLPAKFTISAAVATFAVSALLYEVSVRTAETEAGFANGTLVDGIVNSTQEKQNSRGRTQLVTVSLPGSGQVELRYNGCESPSFQTLRPGDGLSVVASPRREFIVKGCDLREADLGPLRFLIGPESVLVIAGLSVGLLAWGGYKADRPGRYA